jgi:small neutral amino acid transporter SnatA (MarC family)
MPGGISVYSITPGALPVAAGDKYATVIYLVVHKIKAHCEAHIIIIILGVVVAMATVTLPKFTQLDHSSY